jgi:WD40 repeat protein
VLSPDGKTLVTAGRKGPLVFWDFTQDPPRTHVEPFPAGVNAIAVSPDGTLLAVADAAGTIELRDLKSHQRAAGPVIPKQPSEVTGLAFGPANLLAFAYTSDESSRAVKIQVWDLAKQEAAGSFDATADGSVSTLAFSHDGRMLASSGVGAETILWDRATGEKLQSDFLKDTGSLAFSPDGQWLASGSWQLTVRKTTDFEAVIFPLPDAPAHTSAVRFSPDGKVLVSGSSKGTVIVWDVAARRPLEAPYQLKMGAINDLVLSPDGRTVYAGNAAGQIAVVTLDTTPLRRVLPTRGYVGDLKFNAATGELASSDDKGNVNFWNASSGSLLRQIRSSHGSVVVFAIGPDGKTIAVGDVKGRVSTWDAGTLQSLSDPAQVKNDRIDRLEFAPDGRSVAVAGIDPEIAIWDAAQRARPKTLTADKEYARHALFTRDGSRLITVGDAGDLLQWDWRTGARISQAMKVPSGADALALSPDGDLLAVGDYGDRITLWDLKQGQTVGVPLVAHTNIVRAVTFSTDGRFMASGGDDGVAILWDVKSRQPIAHFGHGETVLSGDGTSRTARAVNHVSFSPDGSVLATDGPEDAILLWDVDIASWKGQACHRTNRNLTAEEWRRYIGDLPYRETCPGGRPRSER